jgi:dTDP-glucose 4,6-dehydratase
VTKRLLVTGGAGFIGSAVCRHLVADLGCEVIALDKLTYAANLASLDPVADDPRFRLEVADVCDPAALARIFETHRPHAVIHLAAESHVDRSITGARVFVDTNVVGAFRLLEACRHYLAGAPAQVREAFRYVQTSTDEVFGELGPDGCFTETSPYRPSSPYSATKAAADHLAQAWMRTYGLPVIISHGSNTYGPCQFPEKLIPTMILAALEGRPLPVYGEGINVRDWLHVDDHARALGLMAREGRTGEAYAVGARCERRNIDLVRRICALMDEMRPAGAPHARLIAHVPDRPGHDHRYALDPGKLERELGWRPQQSFDAGLEATVSWYLERRDWWEPLIARAPAPGT